MKILKMVPKAFFILSILFSSTNSYGLSPEKRLENPDNEKRARNLFVEIKCLVCEAQSIESSNTEFSEGLRAVIREKIENGQSDDEIKKDLEKEFGDQIFMSPNFDSALLVWVLPLIFSGLFGFFLFRRK